VSEVGRFGGGDPGQSKPGAARQQGWSDRLLATPA